jgi:membrane associated rhomboid family serine protease
MLPIRDDAPRSTTPYVTYVLVALNALVFLFEVSLGPQARNGLIFQFGLEPVNITAYLRGMEREVGGFVPAFLPVLTSMFLHASWLHIIFNMWALWIFGDNVEDNLGHTRYLVFYLICGLGASILHVLLNPTSEVPSVGASGAIAGVMGAYFVLFPSARVLTVIPFFFLYFTWLPAWLVLGYWFVAQFLSGAATSIAYSKQTSGVAFWAHVGGFVTGVTLIKLFPRRAPRYRFDTWH